MGRFRAFSKALAHHDNYLVVLVDLIASKLFSSLLPVLRALPDL